MRCARIECAFSANQRQIDCETVTVGVMPAHPGRKNKNAARVGHPGFGVLPSLDRDMGAARWVYRPAVCNLVVNQGNGQVMRQLSR